MVTTTSIFSCNLIVLSLPFCFCPGNWISFFIFGFNPCVHVECLQKWNANKMQTLCNYNKKKRFLRTVSILSPRYSGPRSLCDDITLT